MRVMSLIVRLAVLTLLTSMSMMAQTASDLRAKYGPPSEIYEISPLISLTVKFAQDSQACEMLITERHGSTPGSDDKRLPPEVTAVDVLNKLIPETQRGAKIHSTSTTGNCFDLRTELYENVTISRYENTCGSPSSVERTVQILWKNRPCRGRETTIDTQVTGPPAGTSSTTPTLSNRIMPQVAASSACGTDPDATFIDYKRTYRKYEVSQSAELLSLPHPELTPEAIEHKATGSLIIEAVLGPCGEVTNLVLRGHVLYGLTDRAIVATRKIKFKPAMENGRPVPQRIQVEYSFYLCNKAPICTRVAEVVD